MRMSFSLKIILIKHDTSKNEKKRKKERKKGRKKEKQNKKASTTSGITKSRNYFDARVHNGVKPRLIEAHCVNGIQTFFTCRVKPPCHHVLISLASI